MLSKALESCATQSVLPNEVVLGDDSSDDTTERIVSDLSGSLPFFLNYRRNNPPLGQNANVNDIFLRARSSHLVLLHDDDLLLPNALATLASCWDREPSIDGAFGKQIVITHDGHDLIAESIRLNETYGRLPSVAGLQRESWRVGLQQQLPNDGYMLRTSVAQQMLWRPASEVGAGGEFDFGVRLGFAGHEFYFVDAYTSKYRLSTRSMSRSRLNDAALQAYLLAESLALSTEANVLRNAKLSRSAPAAMRQALRLQKRRVAWRIYRSRHHSWKRRFSLGGISRLLSLLSPRSW